MCIYIYIHMYTHIYIGIYIYIHTHIHTYTYASHLSAKCQREDSRAQQSNNNITATAT